MHDKAPGQHNPPPTEHGDNISEKPEAPTRKTTLDIISQLIKVLSVVAGVVISVVSFTSAQKHEAEVRRKEASDRLDEAKRYADQRESESAKPFVVLRQKLYLEAVQVAAVLANPEDHTEDELKKARKRFRELYVSELSLVEGVDVEHNMKELAAQIDPSLINFTPAQRAAYHLAHALRDSLRKSWNFNNDLVDNPNY